MNKELYGFASVIRRESNDISRFLGNIPECKSKNPKGLNEISSPLAKMTSISLCVTIVTDR